MPITCELFETVKELTKVSQQASRSIHIENLVNKCYCFHSNYFCLKNSTTC